jgi:glycosyltransferase involved in cell wall biosynthesis
VHPTDSYACGHYRMAWPAEVLYRDGLDVTLVKPRTSTGLGGLMLDGEITGLTAPDCDVMVFQRPARRLIADIIPHLRAKGIAVVVDIDDDLERIHPSNPAFKGMHPRLSPDYNWDHVRRSCREATLVTVSTPALAGRYGGHGRVRLLRNYAPARFLDVPHDPAEGSVGWAGSMHSHPDDLGLAAVALSRLAGEGRGLRFVGPDEGVSDLLGAPEGEIEFTGNVELEDWIPQVARLGVGVAPLADTTFNEAKSWLKPLEYSAAGVPWVASPTPEYQLLAKACGMPTAARPKDWYCEVRRLLDDEALREDASGRVRTAAAGLTVEAHAHLWAEAWAEALGIERKAGNSTTDRAGAHK